MSAFPNIDVPRGMLLTNCDMNCDISILDTMKHSIAGLLGFSVRQNQGSCENLTFNYGKDRFF